jgi:thiol-disulfide isomerase/thioredoxin
VAAILLDRYGMNWKAIVCCLLSFALLPALRATDPVSFREIAMLLRNGEDQQYIIKETARRKLLESLSEAETQTLLSLHASPALMSVLRDPANILPPDSAAAYTTRTQREKFRALVDQQLSEQAAADAKRLEQQKLAMAKAASDSGAPPEAGGGGAGQSISLKFSAVDGSTVDLEKLRGKVVLIDFWATWCGPCMKEVPNVVAAYQKYHAKGFEIVGISLDQDKSAMLNVAQQRGMTWPQYFDGKGWKNEVSTRFHIREIPTMWLVNKNGLVATTTARGSLDEEIARLLAE